MGSLSEVIQDPARRKKVVDDCVALIDAEVGDKGGLSGMAIKAAFATVKGVKPGIIPMSMDHLLDDFSKQVDPFWAECQQKGEQPRAFFARRKSDIANALLKITDDRAKKSSHTTLVKAYNGLRDKAVEHIGTAMPRFADLVQKHAS
jgi:hypothetical protein